MQTSRTLRLNFTFAGKRESLKPTDVGVGLPVPSAQVTKSPPKAEIRKADRVHLGVSFLCVCAGQGFSSCPFSPKV